ncbi:hypothetical protein, conserved [Eimeria maxima]|uniref:Uncharacterized protein n=1 Tax=Eimeria maxima TaxID=5804 RepID=U6M6T8_EIMMA|nr:hypothetical protein, conserved [Eimeria maxima]CDJ58778.1 hypothetical protein, conserved [Eimeria maxima]
MCGILGACCGSASKAFRCCSLRTFAFTWLGISVFIALLQFVAGAYLSSYLTPVDTMLRDIRDRIMELEDPTTALKYYGVIADSLAAVWRGMSLLTTTRGLVDTVAVVLWVLGWYKQKLIFVYVFIGMMAFDFIIDFCLFIIFMAVINALYIAYFFPIALLLPFVFYGWQMFLGPYVLHLLLSHAYVMSVGGDGTEMKSWQEVKEMRETAAQKGEETETARLLSGSSEKKPEKASGTKDTGKKQEAEKVVTVVDDDVMAEAKQEV